MVLDSFNFVKETKIESNADRQWIMALFNAISPLLFTPDKAARGIATARALFKNRMKKALGDGMADADRALCRTLEDGCAKNGLKRDELPPIAGHDCLSEDFDYWAELLKAENGDQGKASRAMLPFCDLKNGKPVISKRGLLDVLFDAYEMKRIGGLLSYFNGRGYLQGEGQIGCLVKDLCRVADVDQPHDMKDIFNQIGSCESFDFGEATKISVGNGIVCIDPKSKDPISLLKHSPDYLIPCMTSVDYVPTIEKDKPEAAIKVTNAFKAWANGDPQIADLLYAAIGLCLFNSMKFKKGFFFVGPKNCGKSSFLSLFTALFGKQLCVYMTLQQGTEKFAGILFINAIVWIADESMGGGIDGENNSRLKIILSGEMIKAEAKFENPQFFRPHAKVMGAGNELPDMTDPATYGRFIYVPFTNHFDSSKTSNNGNSNAGFDLARDPDCLRVILFRSVNAFSEMLMRDLKGNDPFPECKAAENLKRSHLERLKPVYAWIESLEGSYIDRASQLCLKSNAPYPPVQESANLIMVNSYFAWLAENGYANPGRKYIGKFIDQVIDYFHEVGIELEVCRSKIFYDPSKDKSQGAEKIIDAAHGFLRNYYFQFIGSSDSKNQEKKGE